MSILRTAPGLCKRIKRILESTTISAFAAGASNTLAERTAISGFLTSLSKTLHNLQSKGGKEAKNKKNCYSTTTRLSPIEGHNNAYYKIANIFEDL